MRFRTLLLGLAAAAFVVPASAQTPNVTVSADIAANTTWTAGNVYLLDGLVYVRPGATLTIQPGTVIKGKGVPSASTGDLASGLVVMVGARLVADGTQTAPIIFTAEADNVAVPDDLTADDRGTWGGVILLGRATTNSTPGIQNIEGVPTSSDTRFGCAAGTPGFECNDDDDSGSLQFVSIRHGGFGFNPNSEINGLTMGAVGRGTRIEHVEVFANSDDAFEWFGGTVRAKYLVAAFNGDDAFDWDRGYRGGGQWWFSIQNPGLGAGRCMELDGGDSALGGEDAQPYAIPVVSNVTCIGIGVGNAAGDENNDRAWLFRDNTGGHVYNSVVTDFRDFAVEIEALASGEDSENRFGQNLEGTNDLTVRNNVFFGFGQGSTFAQILVTDSDNSVARQAEIATLLTAANTVADPMLRAVSRERNAGLDPRPSPTGVAASGALFAGTATAGDPFFTPVAYRGAFDAGAAVWLAGWTTLAQNGYLAPNATVAGEASPEALALGLSARPNPATAGATVRFTLDRAQTVRVALYDVLGRRVAVVAEGLTAAGETVSALPTTSLPAGIYVVRLTAETGTATQTLTVVR